MAETIPDSSKRKRVILAVHGGAGIILRDNLTTESEHQYRTALKDALMAGFSILSRARCEEETDTGEHASTSTSIAADAAEAAVRSLEDCPLFNAGKGSVFGHDGKIRMDASIMACHLDLDLPINLQHHENKNNISASIPPPTSPHQITQKRKHPPKPHPRAGAVAGVSNIQNPVSLARAVMERTPHVMLIGEGAMEFAETLPPNAGVEYQPDDYFWTERRWKQLEDVLEHERKQHEQQQHDCGIAKKMVIRLDHSSSPSVPTEQEIANKTGNNETNNKSICNDEHEHRKFGTVGCVALHLPEVNDNHLHPRAQLASATSTGGMTNVHYHRVGDSPIIGAGTYANSLCAVSCTGHGEWFIRCTAAHDVAARLEYKYGYDGSSNVSKIFQGGDALKKAVSEVVFGSLMGDGSDNGGDSDSGGDGGIIALDREGNFVGEMNCPGMYHAWVYEDGEMVTRIFWDECTHSTYMDGKE